MAPAAFETWYEDDQWPACATVDELLEVQRYRCAICATDFRDPGVRKMLDHCHFCGKVRGWLCNNCNGRESRSTDEVIVSYRASPPAERAGLQITYPGRRPAEALARYTRNVFRGYRTGSLPGDCTPDRVEVLIQALVKIDELKRSGDEISTRFHGLRKTLQAASIRERDAEVRFDQAMSLWGQYRRTVLIIGTLAGLLWAVSFFNAARKASLPGPNADPTSAIIGAALCAWIFVVMAAVFNLLRIVASTTLQLPSGHPIHHVVGVFIALTLVSAAIVAVLAAEGVLGASAITTSMVIAMFAGLAAELAIFGLLFISWRRRSSGRAVATI